MKYMYYDSVSVQNDNAIDNIWFNVSKTKTK